MLKISRGREARIERSGMIALRALARDDGCAGSFAIGPQATVRFVVAVASTGVQQTVGGQQGFPPFAAPTSNGNSVSGQYVSGQSAGSHATGGGARGGNHGGAGSSDKSAKSPSSGNTNNSGHSSPSVDYAALKAPSDGGGNLLPIVILLLLAAAGAIVVLGPDIRRAALKRRNLGGAAGPSTSASEAPIAAEGAAAHVADPDAAKAQVAPDRPHAAAAPLARRAGWVSGHRSLAAMVLASLGGALQLMTRRRRAHRRRRR
jgi:hypothetical protein